VGMSLCPFCAKPECIGLAAHGKVTRRWFLGGLVATTALIVAPPILVAPPSPSLDVELVRGFRWDYAARPYQYTYYYAERGSNRLWWWGDRYPNVLTESQEREVRAQAVAAFRKAVATH